MVYWVQYPWSATFLMYCGARIGETCGCYSSGWSTSTGASFPLFKGQNSCQIRWSPLFVLTSRKANVLRYSESAANLLVDNGLNFVIFSESALIFKEKLSAS